MMHFTGRTVKLSYVYRYNNYECRGHVQNSWERIRVRKKLGDRHTLMSYEFAHRSTEHCTEDEVQRTESLSDSYSVLYLCFVWCAMISFRGLVTYAAAGL